MITATRFLATLAILAFGLPMWAGAAGGGSDLVLARGENLSVPGRAPIENGSVVVTTVM